MASELTEALEHLDMIDFLEYEGIDYKERTGSSGPQFNIQECPSCGDRKWRVWINQESGLGNCFHGDCTQKTFNKYSFMAIDNFDNAAIRARLHRMWTGISRDFLDPKLRQRQ